MSKTVRIALAGPGAFGIKHLDALKNIDGVEVVSLIGRELGKAHTLAFWPRSTPWYPRECASQPSLRLRQDGV